MSLNDVKAKVFRAQGFTGTLNDGANSFYEDALINSTIIVDDTTDSTSPTTGSIQTDGGLGVVKTIVAGLGIKLGGNAADNLLDFFRADNFQVGLTCGTSGTITLNSSINLLFFTKLGDRVFVNGAILVDSVSSPLGALRMTGLPFTSGNIGGFAERSGTYIAVEALASALHIVQGRIVQASTELIIEEFNGTTAVDDVCNHIQSGTILTFDFSYIAV